MKVRWIVAFLLTAFTGVVGAQGQAPTAETALGSVRIPRSVKADGKDLKAGTYQVRLTAQDAAPAVPGITMERWVEFVQGGKVVGKEIASIVSAADIKAVAEMKPPAPGSSRVDGLKGSEYLRVWINKGGTHYLVNLSAP
jgi:hypothetical protein